MTLQREDLERAFSNFEMPEPAFDRLQSRRRRKERRARIGAAVVAIVVVAAIVGFLAREFDTRRRPAVEPTPVAQIPSVARVTCTGGNGEQLESHTVAVQPDGMRFELLQDHGGKPSEVRLESRDFGSIGISVTDPDRPVLATVGDMYLAPGTYSVTCTDSGTPSFGDPGDGARIEFVDPEGYFGSTALACDEDPPSPGYNTLSLPGFTGGDPEPAVRAVVDWLQPTDVFEPAGYSAGVWPTHVIFRDGVPIARFMYDERKQPDWVYFDGCDGDKMRAPQR